VALLESAVRDRHQAVTLCKRLYFTREPQRNLNLLLCTKERGRERGRYKSLLLMHVADGWVARNFRELNLAESEEMQQDRAYLELRAAELRDEGFEVDYLLALGEPSDEIVKAAAAYEVDLIAMSTHGHRFISDLLYGSTADKVRHIVNVPVLLLKAKR